MADEARDRCCIFEDIPESLDVVDGHLLCVRSRLLSLVGCLSPTWSRKRTPAHGRAAWIGAYCTAISPTCLKQFTHFKNLASTSRRMTCSPFFLLNFQALFLHSSRAVSVSLTGSDTISDFSVRPKSMTSRWSDWSLAHAILQRFSLPKGVGHISIRL
jgi:hypothetical protein